VRCCFDITESCNLVAQEILHFINRRFLHVYTVVLKLPIILNLHNMLPERWVDELMSSHPKEK